MGRLHGLTVFDLDGTLVDSRRDLAGAANALIAEHGGAPLDEHAVGRMVGEGAKVLVQRALTAAGLTMDESSLPRFLALYDERLLRTTRPYPGIVRALERMAGTGAALAVLTNKPIGPTRALLAGLGLAQFFEDALGGDGPLPRKPSPLGLQHLAAAFGVETSRTVLVGDSHIDAATARAAGTRFCLAGYGYGAEDLGDDVVRGADAVAREPADLPDLIGKLLM